MAWYDDPELVRGIRALARMAFAQRFDSTPPNDPLGEYIERKRAEKRARKNTDWTISWGEANATFFKGDQLDEMTEYIRGILARGYTLRAISRRRGGIFDENVETLEFDSPKKLGGLWGFLENVNREE